MRIRIICRIALGAFSAGGLAGCQHASRSSASQPEISFQFIAPPARASREISEADLMAASSDVFISAEPCGELRLPDFPRVARTARAGPTTMTVHLTVDSSGRVTEVGPSPVGFTMPSPFGAEFSAAIERAVRQWKFLPAEIRTLQPVQIGQRTLLKVVRSETIETGFDVAFTFSHGGVTLFGPKQ